MTKETPSPPEEKNYKLLDLPVSYHLLCRKIAERLRNSHQHFIQGDKEKALDVMKLGRGR